MTVKENFRLKISRRPIPIRKKAIIDRPRRRKLGAPRRVGFVGYAD
jgi:hypothetical protein